MTLPERAGSDTVMYLRYLEITGLAFLHTQITTVQSQGFQRSDVCSFPKLCTAHISHVHEIHLSISLTLIKRLTLVCLDLNSPHLGICTIPQQLVSVFRAPVCCSNCSHMRQLKQKIITPSKLSTFKKYKCTPDILIPVLGSSVSFMRGMTFTRCREVNAPCHSPELDRKEEAPHLDDELLNVTSVSLVLYTYAPGYTQRALTGREWGNFSLESPHKRRFLGFWNLVWSPGRWLQSKRVVKPSHLVIYLLDLRNAAWISHSNDSVFLALYSDNTSCKPRFTNFWAGLRYTAMKFSNNKIWQALFFNFSPNGIRGIWVCHMILNSLGLREKYVHVFFKQNICPCPSAGGILFSSADWFTEE